MPQDTIFALSSGAGRAGVAIVRLSGGRACDVLRALCGTLPAARQAVLRALRDPRDSSLIDHALVLYFPAPHSFTGEDVVEFQVHGSVAVLRQLFAVLGQQPGCRLAEAGNFTRRAFLNGKLDLIGVEALGDLLVAETDLQRKLAQTGSMRLRAMAEGWREKLTFLRASLEAQIDFGEEDEVLRHVDSDTEQIILTLCGEIEALLAQAPIGERIRQGYRIAILGPPNAGKSSLLNALADRDIAITSPLPGTTRDVLEAQLDFDGLPVIVLDTAGLRDARDALEAEGIERAKAAGAQADLILWANPVDSPTKCPDPNYLELHTKADLLPENHYGSGLYVSASTKQGLTALVAKIKGHALGGSEDRLQAGLLSHHRQVQALNRAYSHLVAAFRDDSSLDMRAEDIRMACAALDALIGRIGVDDVLDAIFSRFCIGK